MNSDDYPDEDVTYIEKKFDDMTDKVRETADGITSRVKKLTDAFDIPNPHAPPDAG